MTLSVFNYGVLSLKMQIENWKGTYSTGLSISKGAASITEFPDYSIDQLVKEAEQRMNKDKTRFYIESGIERRRV